MAVTEEQIELEDWKLEKGKCNFFKRGDVLCHYGTVTVKCSPLNCIRVSKAAKESLRCGDCQKFHTCDMRVVTGNADMPCENIEI